MGMAELVWLCTLVEKFWKKSQRLEWQRISGPKFRGSHAIMWLALFTGKRRVQNRVFSALRWVQGLREKAYWQSVIRQGIPHDLMHANEVLCICDNHLSPALSPDINVRFLGLDFKIIELSSNCRLLYWSCLVLRLHVFPNLMGVIYMYFDSSWELWTDCAQFGGVRLNFQWKCSRRQLLPSAVAREETQTPSRNWGKTLQAEMEPHRRRVNQQLLRRYLLCVRHSSMCSESRSSSPRTYVLVECDKQ